MSHLDRRRALIVCYTGLWGFRRTPWLELEWDTCSRFLQSMHKERFHCSVYMNRYGERKHLHSAMNLCFVHKKCAWYDKWNFRWMFQFCWEMSCVHQGSPGAEWKFSEGKRRKVSILPACNIVRPSGAPSAKSSRLSVTRLVPILLSPAWPGAPHILLSSNPGSSYPPWDRA